MSRQEETKFAFYCSCGGAMTGAVAPATGVPDLEDAFRTVHSGQGHEPTTRDKAANARRAADRRELLRSVR